jgi:hypothetical protein
MVIFTIFSLTFLGCDIDPFPILITCNDAKLDTNACMAPCPGGWELTFYTFFVNELWFKWHFVLPHEWMEAEAVGSKLIGCVCNLPIKEKCL